MHGSRFPAANDSLKEPGRSDCRQAFTAATAAKTNVTKPGAFEPCAIHWEREREPALEVWVSIVFVRIVRLYVYCRVRKTSMEASS